MDIYENLLNFDTAKFSPKSLTMTAENDGLLPYEWYGAMQLKCPNKNRPKLAILLAEDYVDNCWGAYVQIAHFFACYNYQIKRISNATQLDDCAALVLPDADIKLPSQFYCNSKKSMGYLLEVQAFAQCIKVALTKGIPLLAIGTSMQLLAGMSGLKLCRSVDIKTTLNHEHGIHDIEVAEGSSFYKLNGCWVNSCHFSCVAPPRKQRELLRLADDDKLPFWAFAKDGIPEALCDVEHGILGIQWVPDFMRQVEQLELLAWLKKRLK